MHPLHLLVLLAAIVATVVVVTECADDNDVEYELTEDAYQPRSRAARNRPNLQSARGGPRSRQPTVIQVVRASDRYTQGVANNAAIRSHPNWPHDTQAECGQSASDRIVGGTNASLGQYPWLALLGIRSEWTHTKNDFRSSYITCVHIISNNSPQLLSLYDRSGRHHTIRLRWLADQSPACAQCCALCHQSGNG